MREVPDMSASLMSRVLGGTAVTIQEQKEDWVKIRLVGGRTGWLPQDNLRAQNSQPQDIAPLRAQLVADAHRLTGVPYLWGGSSAYGIDCSGMVQLVHRLSGIILPRDADLQCENGRLVEPPYQPGDLFFFGESGGHRRISHVGMSLGGWEMIHASRSQNGVYQDNVQAVEHLRTSFLGARTYL
jgi:cell wall-associated NlpC family hydrolase